MLRANVEEYTLTDGRKIYLLGEGRLINLAAAEGHPAVVMDMSFANQALSAEYLAKNAKGLKLRSTQCRRISISRSRAEARSDRGNIDKLTAEQDRYLASWNEGT